jgi:dynein heavy chain
MYQYSLTYFLRLNNSIIEAAEKNEVQSVRIATLLSEITRIVFNNICRGLFNRHKLIFAFMIVSRIFLQAGNITVPEWDIFLKGVIMDGNIKSTKNPDPEVISEKQWRFILNLECISESFDGLSSSISTAYDTWKPWLTAKEPQNIDMPEGWE